MPRLPDWTLCPRPWPGRAGRLAAAVQQPVAAFAKGRVRWPYYVADARISFASFTNEAAVPDQFAALFQLDRCAGRPPASQPSRSSACAPAAGRCPLRRALASDLADCAAGHARSMRRRRPHAPPPMLRPPPAIDVPIAKHARQCRQPLADSSIIKGQSSKRAAL